MKSIKEYQKKGIGEIIGMYLREAWYFEKWHEKLIMLGLSIIGFSRVIDWIF